MKNYGLLKSRLADSDVSVLADDKAKADYLNDKVIQMKQHVSTKDIIAYLVVVGKWRAIVEGTSVEAKDAVDVLTLFNTIDMTNPLYLNKTINVLDNLVSVGLISSDDKLYILGMGDTMKSWADINWIGDVTLTDIQNAYDYVVQ